jgi:hypothetical protein
MKMLGNQQKKNNIKTHLTALQDITLHTFLYYDQQNTEQFEATIIKSTTLTFHKVENQANLDDQYCVIPCFSE